MLKFQYYIYCFSALHLLVSVGHLCDLPTGFAVSDNLVTLFLHHE